MQNTFVFSMLFCYHRNLMAICLPTLPSCSTRRFWMRVRDWWQRILISPEMRCFFTTVSNNMRIIKGVCHVIHVRHKHMRSLVREEILRLRCLQACIVQLKSAMLI